MTEKTLPIETRYEEIIKPHSPICREYWIGKDFAEFGGNSKALADRRGAIYSSPTTTLDKLSVLLSKYFKLLNLKP